MKKFKVWCCFEALIKSVSNKPIDLDELKELLETILTADTPFRFVNVRQLSQKEVK